MSSLLFKKKKENSVYVRRGVTWSEANLVTKVNLGEAEGLQMYTGCSDGWCNALS